MPEESVSNEEQVLVLSWKTAFVDHEVALAFITLVKVLFWVNFENVVTHLESNWFDLGGNLLAWLLDMAESLIGFAVEIW